MSEKPEQYLHVQIKAVPSHLEDVVTEICFSFGASGVSEDLTFEQASSRYIPDIIEQSEHVLNVFFEKIPEEEFYQRISQCSPEINLDKKMEQNKDWLEEWKKGYRAFPLVGSTWVVPTWLPVPAAATEAILIDPGMAFGTGTHATTQLAAEMIVRHSDQFPENFSVLDVGTGTGILAFLCEKLKAGRVEGTEIDADARRVAGENARQNKSEKVQILEHQIEQVQDQYDVVIANIIDGILLQLKPDLLRCLKPGGHLFLTGILSERFDEFKAEFLKDIDLQVLEKCSKSEWAGLVFRNLPSDPSKDAALKLNRKKTGKVSEIEE